MDFAAGAQAPDELLRDDAAPGACGGANIIHKKRQNRASPQRSCRY